MSNWPFVEAGRLLDVFLADRVVVSLGIRLYFEVGQILFGSRLEIIVLVNNGSSRITPRGRSEEEPQPVRLAHEAL